MNKLSKFVKHNIEHEVISGVISNKFNQVSENLDFNYLTKDDTSSAINNAIGELSLVYAPINVVDNLRDNYYTKEGTLSSITDAIDDLTEIYTPITGFNEFKNDILIGYLTKNEISGGYTALSSFIELTGNVYTKSETYTKTEVSQAIANAQHIKKEIVEELPEIENALENTIYLVSNSTSLSSNIYDEFLLINNNWERIGNTAIDITNFANLNNENTFLDDQTIFGDLTVIDNINCTTITASSSGSFQGDLTLNGRSLSSDMNYLNETIHPLIDVGDRIIEINSAFDPRPYKVYKRTLAANDIITFNTSYLSNNFITSFELHLIQPATPVSFTFANSIKWIHDLNFNSSNEPPDFSEGNKEYALIIRWDGTEFLGNLIYTKDIE